MQGTYALGEAPRRSGIRRLQNTVLKKADPRNCDRRFTPSQRHTQEPLKRNDIFI